MIKFVSNLWKVGSLLCVQVMIYHWNIYRITSVMKVKTGLITSTTVSPLGWAIIFCDNVGWYLHNLLFYWLCHNMLDITMTTNFQCQSQRVDSWHWQNHLTKSKLKCIDYEQIYHVWKGYLRKNTSQETKNFLNQKAKEI